MNKKHCNYYFLKITRDKIVNIFNLSTFIYILKARLVSWSDLVSSNDLRNDKYT